MLPRLFDPTPARVEQYRLKGDVPGLIRALRAKDFRVSEAASDALAEMEKDITAPLLSELRRKDSHAKLGVIGIFAKTRDPRAVPSLIGMLSDPGSEVRWQATIALGEIGDPVAIAPLSASLYDRDKYVRYGAATALAKLGWEPTEGKEKAGYYTAVQEWDAVKNIGVPAITVLDNILNDRDPILRLKAVRTLGEIGDAAAFPSLVRALRDENRDVRWQAVLSSQHCGIPLAQVPRALSERPKNQKNPFIAGFMNFMLPGLGYGYLGKWWGIMIFQIDITATVWLFRFEGESITYQVLFLIYLVLAIHAWYLAESMPEDPP